jgi:hypothetical protein
MNKSSSKHKLKGIIFSLIFHLIAIACFFYFGLSYQTPPPDEKGIAINFGFNNTSNNINIEEVKTPPEIKKVNNSNLITPPNNTIPTPHHNPYLRLLPEQLEARTPLQ